MSSSNFSDIINTLKPDLLLYDLFQPWSAALASSLEFTHGHAAFPYRAIYLRDYERINRNFRSIIKDGGDDFAFGNYKQSCDIVWMNSCRAIEEIMQWLSQKNQFSTVFISFGSENYLSKEQIEETARGLELCDVNFIWVVRFPVGNTTRIEETLPEGFLDRVKERGIIVQDWAPQAKILAHQSMGGFVGHCGWSSIVESIYFGVPVIAMPLKLDQPLNASLMVEHGAAIEVVRNDGGRFDGDKVAKAIKMLVLEKTGEGMRSKAIELSEQ
ncbi:beta-D-glucosyl crocetin beta-1,6-glucosyltransferase-like [Olea europaea subsp. europaea]|uniref:Beta-D-glucosyl crocetin beta-1,6-glucosyltransferase-like n=1 Tax=Olea europaea subsp. europaea TaxID=158383 RepID=A0A8S0UT00_OLEEU|nr:beta-D-glucosyl crocetin beta-1,6-glucosyltransferase-like [Olea europaea subsp. europaea]